MDTKQARYERNARAERHDENLNRVCPACEGYGMIGNGLSHQNDQSCWLCGEYGWTTNARWYGYHLDQEQQIRADLNDERAMLDPKNGTGDMILLLIQISRSWQRTRRLQHEADYLSVSPDDFIEERNARYARD